MVEQLWSGDPLTKIASCGVTGDEQRAMGDHSHVSNDTGVALKEKVDTARKVQAARAVSVAVAMTVGAQGSGAFQFAAYCEEARADVSDSSFRTFTCGGKCRSQSMS